MFACDVMQTVIGCNTVYDNIVKARMGVVDTRKPIARPYPSLVPW